MSLRDHAINLARRGLKVFKLLPDGKTPAVFSFSKIATADLQLVHDNWTDPLLDIPSYFNIGISTHYFGDEALLVLDVDNKDGKNGSDTLLALELEGKTLPKTFTQSTPTGGFHYFYKVKKPLSNTVGKLGPGLDTRSHGGYVVGAGSIVPAGEYKIIEDVDIAPAPSWLVESLREVKEKKTPKTKLKINQKRARTQGKKFLLEDAPIAIEGEGGDHTTFKVCTRLKDIGLTPENALELLLEHYNPKCQPPWDVDHLKDKVHNAYSYGQNEIGSSSPESDFGPVEVEEKKEVLQPYIKPPDPIDSGPVLELNKKFSFIVIGGKSAIIHKLDKDRSDFITVQAFHDLLKAETVQLGSGKMGQLSEVWFKSPHRATYHAAELIPKGPVPDGTYNLWRGFSCEPLGKDEKPTEDMIEGVRLFKEHALENICLGDETLFNWLMAYFAHMVQYPEKKPLTALVFKGEKGTGKNALIDRVGRLFRGHYLLTSNKRYVTSNFNQHLANLVLFVLDEAFWSGDKHAEGILKDLITGHTHLIEQKGREMFSAKNITRICIIGNEDWVVPASKDERRFAVFDVGNARQGDRKYFRKMRKLIDEKGGNRLLLRELQEFDLDEVDINKAPDTLGLLEQKIQSLNPIHSWWYACLRDGELYGLDFAQGWPDMVAKNQLREAFISYAKNRGVRGWLPDGPIFGKNFKKVLPKVRERRRGGGGDRAWCYKIPSLSECREEFERFMRYKIDWEEDSEELNAEYLFS